MWLRTRKFTVTIKELKKHKFAESTEIQHEADLKDMILDACGYPDEERNCVEVILNGITSGEVDYTALPTQGDK